MGSQSAKTINALNDQLMQGKLFKTVACLVHKKVEKQRAEELVTSFNEKRTSFDKIHEIRVDNTVQSLYGIDGYVSILSVDLSSLSIASLKKFFFSKDFPVAGKGRHTTKFLKNSATASGTFGGTYMGCTSISFLHPETAERVNLHLDVPQKFNTFLKRNQTSMQLLKAHKLKYENINQINGNNNDNISEIKNVISVANEISFGDRNFYVDGKVFLPRISSYSLVVAAKTYIETVGMQILDIGCGSGNLSISLALEAADKQPEIIGIDINPSAIILARKNAIKHNLSKICHFKELNLLKLNLATVSSRKFDLVLCNPPYLADKAIDHLYKIKQSPLEAISGGVDELRFYKNFVSLLLKPDFRALFVQECIFLFEIPGNDRRQRDKIIKLFRKVNLEVSQVLFDQSKFCRGLVFKFKSV